MTGPVVIVGGGLAAATAAVTLREEGFDGPVVVHCAEPHPPYERPPLSKGYLTGREPAEKLCVRPVEWYGEHDVELVLGSRVERIDLAERRVRAGRRTDTYDRLLLATGATPRRLLAADAAGVPAAYLRTVEDSDRLREALRPGRRVAIVGAGFLGLEVAAAAREAGADVTVVEAGPAPLGAVLGDRIGMRFAELHRDHGVDLRLATSVAGLERAGERVRLRLGDGAEVVADLLVVGIGAAPSTRLALDAGLTVETGVVVDDRLRTSDPHVYAAGDVADAWHPVLQRFVRVEHWANAKAQGATAARNLLGADVAHTALPYFFTDQYELGMEYVGHAPPGAVDEVVVHGDLPGLAFTAYWLGGGRVLAAMHVNQWDALEELRQAVGAAADAVG